MRHSVDVTWEGGDKIPSPRLSPSTPLASYAEIFTRMQSLCSTDSLACVVMLEEIISLGIQTAVHSVSETLQ